MIIYAFYGLGKTTFVEKHNTISIDIDEQNYMLSCDFPKNYVKHINENHNNGKVVFVNARKGIINDENIEIAFIPENMDMVIHRLKERGVNEEFIKELIIRKDEILKELKSRFPNAIVITKDKFLCDYEDLIVKRMFSTV